MGEINTELITPFISATHKTFENMLFMKVYRKEACIKRGYRMFGDISGVIGMSGKTTGTAAVSLPAELAVKCIEQMLGEKVKGGIRNVAVHDGIGEIVNVIAGNARSILATTKYVFDVTLPTIISGKDHEIFHKKGIQCVVIQFETGDKAAFTLEICLQAGG